MGHGVDHIWQVATKDTPHRPKFLPTIGTGIGVVPSTIPCSNTPLMLFQPPLSCFLFCSEVLLFEGAVHRDPRSPPPVVPLYIGRVLDRIRGRQVAQPIIKCVAIHVGDFDALIAAVDPPMEVLIVSTSASDDEWAAVFHADVPSRVQQVHPELRIDVYFIALELHRALRYHTDWFDGSPLTFGSNRSMVGGMQTWLEIENEILIDIEGLLITDQRYDDLIIHNRYHDSLHVQWEGRLLSIIVKVHGTVTVAGNGGIAPK